MCVLKSPGRLTGIIVEGVTAREVLTSSSKERSVVGCIIKGQQMVSFDEMNSKTRDFRGGRTDKIQRWP